MNPDVFTGTFLAIVGLGWLIWHVGGIAAEVRVRHAYEQAGVRFDPIYYYPVDLGSEHFDMHVAASLALGNETPIYDEVAVAQFRRQLDEFGGVA